MLQQLIALIIIFFFLSRLYWQKRKNQISGSEFFFWLVFWLLAALAILFIKFIDKAVARLGFSGSGIDVLFYFGMALMFYLIFRLRIRLEKQEKDITRIVRAIALSEKRRDKKD